MPLKLNIAMSRKIGEPNYGSRGATVGLEMEVDTSLVDQPRELHQRIARLFRLAKASVDRELGVTASVGMVHTNHNGTATGPSPPRPATPAQLRAIRAIADRRNIDLSEELRRLFEIDRLEELSLDEASQLIDTIKSATNGAVSQ